MIEVSWRRRLGHEESRGVYLEGVENPQIWSESYGLYAEVNQFKKNLGAPPLPVWEMAYRIRGPDRHNALWN